MGTWRTVALPPGWYGRGGVREQVLLRDPVCMLRTHCRGAPSEQVDHMGAADDHRLHMLRGVCIPCHAHRTGQQGATASNAMRHRRARPVPRHPGLIE